MNVLIQQSDKLQIRIEVKEFKGQKYVDLRQWYQLEDGSYAPTKKGVMLPPELVDDVLDGIKKQKPYLATKIHQVEEPSKLFAIAKSGVDVAFSRKHFYDDLASAMKKAPPDGYNLYRIKVEKGVVVSHKTLRVRKNSKWVTP